MSPEYSDAGGAISAHVQLWKLTNDDHPQYASHKLQRTYGYIAGGQNPNSTAKVEKYDDVADSWTAKTPLTLLKAGPLLGLNGYGYVIGGDTAGGGVGPTAEVEKYDDIADSWTAKHSLTTFRQASSAFIINGFAYVFAGNTGAITNTCEKYDDVADAWTVKATLNTAKYATVGCTLSNYGHCFNGYSGSAYLNQNERYDDVANAWVYRGTNSLNKADSSSFSLNGYGYTIAGDISGGNTARCEKYDNISNTWTTKNAIATSKSSMGGISLNGYGYVCGGSGYTARVDKYDDIADSWTNKHAMALERAYTGGLGFYQGHMTETKYFSPEIVNILRSVSYRAVICGSFNTSSTTSGICNIAHGLGTAPVSAWAIAVRTAATVGDISVDLAGIGGTNLSFVVCSCPMTTFSPTTSSLSVNFVWGAKP